MVYTFLGGLTSAIYNEVLQFLLIVAGFSPLAILAVAKAGGWQGIQTRLGAMTLAGGMSGKVMTHAWTYMGSPQSNPMGVELFGMVAGLGFVLSFGYWCTNFLVVQRAMAADSMNSARRTPLIGAFPKMFLPFIVIVPGIAAVALASMDLGYSIPIEANGAPNYNLVITTLMAKFYPAGMLGVGLTGLMASFMSGMAGTSPPSTRSGPTTFTRPTSARTRPTGTISTSDAPPPIVGVLLSIGAAYVATRYNNIMDLLQLVFGFVNAPLFATFLLGMFWKRGTGHAAFSGLVTGTVAAALTWCLTVAEGKGGILGTVHTFPSAMAQNFWIALMAFTSCFLVTLVVSLATKPRPAKELEGLVYGLTKIPEDRGSWYQRPAPLAVTVIAILLVLNIWFA